MSRSEDGTADHDDSDWLSEMETSESSEDEPCSDNHDSEDARIVLQAPPSTPPCRVPRASRAHAPADSEDGESLGSQDTPMSQRDSEDYDGESGDDESFISETEDLSRDAVQHVFKALRRRRLPSLPLP